MNRENEGVLVALNEVKQWNGRKSRIKFYQGSLPTFAILTYPDFFLADQYINQIHEGTTIVKAERLKHFPNY